MIDLGTLADLHEHQHELHAYCSRCDRWAVIDPARMVAAGHGDRRLPIRVRCQVCGETVRLQVRPPVADFRAGDTAAIKIVCREFIVLCRRWQLFTEATVAIDGRKFKAVNHRDRNFTSAKMKTRMALIEESIAEYLMHLERMDRKETPRNPRQAARLQDRIATLKDEMARLKGCNAEWRLRPMAKCR